MEADVGKAKLAARAPRCNDTEMQIMKLFDGGRKAADPKLSNPMRTRWIQARVSFTSKHKQAFGISLHNQASIDTLLACCLSSNGNAYGTGLQQSQVFRKSRGQHFSALGLVSLMIRCVAWHFRASPQINHSRLADATATFRQRPAAYHFLTCTARSPRISGLRPVLCLLP